MKSSFKILVMGLPGSGKTTLSTALAKRIGAVHFNADEVRGKISKDLGFSIEDRIEQARRMGALCDIVNRSGQSAIADFVCPLPECREAFGKPSLIVFMDRIREGRYADTNSLFVRPDYNGTPVYIVSCDDTDEVVEDIARKVIGLIDRSKPTALFIGRYQPFHAGHKALIAKGIEKVGQAVISVRDTHRADPQKNPYIMDEVVAKIHDGLSNFKGLFEVVPFANITDVCYGRDVGYSITKIDLDADLESISATKIRNQSK